MNGCFFVYTYCHFVYLLLQLYVYYFISQKQLVYRGFLKYAVNARDSRF